MPWQRTSLCLGLVGALLAAAACGPKLKVTTDWSPTADFAALHTFAWIPAPPTPPGPPAGAPPLPGLSEPVGDDLLAGRIRRAVVANLQAKGFREVRAPTVPDFFVTYRAALRSQLDVHSMPTGVGPLGAMGSSLDVHRDEIGTLVIDIVGLDRAQLLWRGTGQADVSSSDARTSPERDQEMTGVVDRILRDFPPPA